ncbi:hypothetical protein MKW94_003850 [Papaver nudicaule]|uniref:DUF4216 domain-containing protein n=1 Tax=Papaver nudicaule TaxID=74823 RepID=A0AA41SHU6_PAPNU|nr:hypothetical protein [Papaver nudicaule]
MIYEQIYDLQRETRQVSKELYSLAGGPCREAVSFRGYILKGYRFHTRDWEKQRKTQNSGIFVKGRDDDDQQEEPAIDFYGALTEIIEVWYAGRFRVLLFKCDWRDVTTERGCRKDKYGFTCVNVDRSAWKEEPFVIARQAEQVFYVKDEENHPWHVAIRTQPRSSFNVPEKVYTEEELCADYSSPAVAFQEKYSGFSIDDLGDQTLEDDNDNFVWDRDDVPVETVDYVAEVDSQRQDDDDDDLETIYTDSSDDDD